jgi:16S rRNA (cytosine1402-N4)-methyltransferase
MKTMKAEYHIPALLMDSIDLLDIRENGVYVDATFGGGGHSREILRRLGPQGRLIAFDKDADALPNKIDDSRLLLVKTDFKFIDTVLSELQVGPVQGVLADIGISFHQIDAADRGFSFRFPAQLDMRMDRDGNKTTAASILRSYPEDDLKRILRSYGEIDQAAKIANAIVHVRKSSPVVTTDDLRDVVAGVVVAKNLNKILTLVYQALRIEVNRELEALECLLEGASKVMAPGGRLAIMSYHSLEDRMVKNYFRSGNLEGEDRRDIKGRSLNPWKTITRKAVMPTEEEIQRNPRSRSARLRVAEWIDLDAE